MSEDVLARWHHIVATKDAAGLDDLLAEDVVFRSPVVHTPQVGREITRAYLRAALSILDNASFRYVETWTADRTAVLEFATTVDGVEINGVDIIRWNEDGRITDFKVMVRPLKAIDLLHRRMGDLLMKMRPAGRRSPGSGSRHLQSKRRRFSIACRPRRRKTSSRPRRAAKDVEWLCRAALGLRAAQNVPSCRGLQPRAARAS